MEFPGVQNVSRGCQVVLIDPRKTGQRCSRCGFTYRSNRRSQSEFLSRKCGFHLNADLQASRNIRDKYLVDGSISPSNALSSTSVSSRSLPVGKGRDQLIKQLAVDCVHVISNHFVTRFTVYLNNSG